MTPDKVLHFASSTFVVLMKDQKGRLTLLADPGMDRPWSSKNKKLADFHAKECNGEARTWGEAFSLLQKEYPQFEKELVERIAKKANDVTKDVLDYHAKKAGINTNPHNDTPVDGTILGADGKPLT